MVPEHPCGSYIVVGSGYNTGMGNDTTDAVHEREHRMTTRTDAPLLDEHEDDGGIEWTAEIREAVQARKQAQEALKERPQAKRPRGMMRRPGS